ncbi:hypothetical protein KEM55_006858, partial [Ascosphaera atra]
DSQTTKRIRSTSNVEIPPSHGISAKRKIVHLKVLPGAFEQRRSVSAAPSPKAVSATTSHSGAKRQPEGTRLPQRVSPPAPPLPSSSVTAMRQSLFEWLKRSAAMPTKLPPSSSAPPLHHLPSPSRGKSGMPPPATPKKYDAVPSSATPAGPGPSPLPVYHLRPMSSVLRTPSKPTVCYSSPDLQIMGVTPRPLRFQFRPNVPETLGHRDFTIRPGMQSFRWLVQHFEDMSLAWEEL